MKLGTQWMRSKRNFYLQFKARFGCTPAHYRARHQQGLKRAVPLKLPVRVQPLYRRPMSPPTL
jgi:hypothetical protein